MTKEPPAWRADPLGRHQYRYWDGAKWTDQVADDGLQSVDAPIAAWLPDPFGRHQHRYWNAARWTDHVSDGGVQGTDPTAIQPPSQSLPPPTATIQPAPYSPTSAVLPAPLVAQDGDVSADSELARGGGFEDGGSVQEAETARPSTIVPAEVLSQLGEFGRDSWNAKISGRPSTDPRFDWQNFLSKVVPVMQTNLPRIVAEIESAAGDDNFARFGGYRLIAEFDAGCQNPAYLRLMDTGLEMMYERGLSSGHMTGYEADRWIATHGDLRTSFDRIVDVPPPLRRAADLVLAPGASLLVAKMGPNALDNEFWIDRTGDSAYAAFSMRPKDSDSTALTRYAEDTLGCHESADGILRGLGAYLRSRPFWAHEQLEPYFTERRER